MYLSKSVDYNIGVFGQRNCKRSKEDPLLAKTLVSSNLLNIKLM